jgi:hypothetical protein
MLYQGFNRAGDLGLGCDLGSFARGSLVVGEGVPEGCLVKLVGGCGLVVARGLHLTWVFS